MSTISPDLRAGGRPLKILHVYKNYAPTFGGIENNIRVLAEAHSALGHTVEVLATASGFRSSRDELEGVAVRRAGRLAELASTPLSPRLALDLWRAKPDIVHLHSPYPVGEMAWLMAGPSPMVMTYHSDIIRQARLAKLWSPWLRKVLDRADRVICTSPPYARTSPFLSRLPQEKLRIVPHGIDLTRFQSGNRQQGLARYGDGPHLVFVGKLRYYKGLGELIKAMPKIDATLLVVGTGPMGSEWRALADQLNVASKIRWLGDLPDQQLPDILAAGDIFVLPAIARSEAFGIVLIEAMAAGLPIISTELGTGTSWVNQDGVTGLVVPPDTPDALARAANAILKDDEIRAGYAGAARQRAEQEFRKEIMTRRVLEIYQELIGDTASS